MPVESATDLAGMFDAAEFAERARYRPPAGGACVPCLVIVDRGQGRRAFSGGKTDGEAAERQIQVQRSQVATVHRDGVFELLDDAGVPTGEAFQVAGLPRLDQGGSLWSADLTIVE